MLDQEQLHLTADECWDLLRTSDLGRLAVLDHGSPDIYPLNYLLGEHVLYFRSAPGDKLAAIGANPAVAFEADGVFARNRWSVVIRGSAYRVNYDSEIEASGVMALDSYLPTDKWNYVRIDPLSITGRRFHRSPRRAPITVVAGP